MIWQTIYTVNNLIFFYCMASIGRKKYSIKQTVLSETSEKMADLSFRYKKKTREIELM